MDNFLSTKHEARHRCMIYAGPPSHKLKLVATIIRRKLNEGYRCLYLNSAPMVAGMCSILAAMEVDIASEVSKSNIILSSSPVFLDQEFVVDDGGIDFILKDTTTRDIYKQKYKEWLSEREDGY